LLVYVFFYVLSDILGVRVAVFRTFGTNAPAASVLEGIVGTAVKDFISLDAPPWHTHGILRLFLPDLALRADDGSEQNLPEGLRGRMCKPARGIERGCHASFFPAVPSRSRIIWVAPNSGKIQKGRGSFSKRAASLFRRCGEIDAMSLVTLPGRGGPLAWLPDRFRPSRR